MAHDDDVGLGQRVFKKAAGREGETAVEAKLAGVFLEDGADFGQIETDGVEVGVRERDLCCRVALRGADVADGLVILEGKLGGDGQGAAVADAGHGFQEVLEAGGVCVERLE